MESTLFESTFENDENINAIINHHSHHYIYTVIAICASLMLCVVIIGCYINIRRHQEGEGNKILDLRFYSFGGSALSTTLLNNTKNIAPMSFGNIDPELGDIDLYRDNEGIDDDQDCL